MRIKLGVIFGGKSVEHEISVISAVQAMEYIDDNKYEVVPIYITKEMVMYTGGMLKDIESYKDFNLIKKFAKKINLLNKNGRFILQSTGLFKKEVNEIDMAFPIVHGNGMEDGTIQGYLKVLNIPTIGSNLYASAVGQDKVFMKQIFEANQIPVTKYVWFNDLEYINNQQDVLKKISKLNYPLIVKPACLGSSVGISKVNNEEELNKKIELAIKYDSKILVEEVVNNLMEVNQAVVGNYNEYTLSKIEEVIKEDDILSYDDKYLKGGKSKGMASLRRIIPARISEEEEKRVNSLSYEVIKSLNTSSVVRIDYLMDKNSKQIYVNEINTIPGSLSYYLFEDENISYPELLEMIISLGIKEYKSKQKRISTFDTNILKTLNGSKFGGIKK